MGRKLRFVRCAAHTVLAVVPTDCHVLCFRRRFGVKQKLQLTLALPLTFGILIAVYVGIKLLVAHASDVDFNAHFAKHHQGRTMTQAILKQVVTIVISGFMFGSVFFLKNVLIPWSCTSPDDAGQTYIRSQPDTPCDLDDEEYATIYALAWTGLVTYLGMFGTFIFFLHKDKCENWFDFLGDKFDAEFFYWEVMLLVRKLLIMVAFMFFADSTEKSWFVGASVVIISLLFHVFAKPFEDSPHRCVRVPLAGGDTVHLYVWDCVQAAQRSRKPKRDRGCTDAVECTGSIEHSLDARHLCAFNGR